MAFSGDRGGSEARTTRNFRLFLAQYQKTCAEKSLRIILGGVS